MKLARSAKIIIIDKHDRALVLRRSSTHPRLALQSDLPGGVIEDKESIEQGLVREILEETGLSVPAESLKLVYSFTRSLFGWSVNRLLYAVRIAETAPEIAISWEHDDYSWKPIDELSGLELPYQEGINYANQHNLWDDV